jgi:hypothetical protein
MAVSPYVIKSRLRTDEKDLPKDVQALQAYANATFTIALAAGASNVMTATIQAVDGFGNTRSGVHNIDVLVSNASTGIGLTSTSYSTGWAATTGSILASITSQKYFKVQTDATGKAVLTLTATGKPATEYVAVVLPRGGLVVSAASGTNFG